MEDLEKVGQLAYEWIINDEISTKEATSFKEYILKNTSEEELSEIKSEKINILKFFSGKYIYFLLK